MNRNPGNVLGGIVHVPVLVYGVGAALLATGIVLYRLFAQRGDFYALLSMFVLCCTGYAMLLWAIWQGRGQLARPIWIMGAGMALRLLLLGDTPALSDDVYRFLWDGHLWNQGVHPFLYTPRVALEQLAVPGLTPQWLALLNSPDYHTVYPPLGQGLFRVAAYFAQGDLFRGVTVIQSLLWFGEFGTLYAICLLLRTQAPAHRAIGLALYAFHPLAILETVGNCHFEGMMMGCVVVGFLFLRRGRYASAGVAWAAGVAIKLLPLMWVPLVAGWLGLRGFWRFFLGFAVGIAVLFAPLAQWQVAGHIQSSLHLYFQQFEFNASLYYLFSYASPFITGWYEGRSISPFLAMLTIGAVVWASWLLYQTKEKNGNLQSLQVAVLWCACVHLFNATTVHPWYVLVPLVASIGTGRYFTAVWAAAAFFSYSHYIGGGRQEHFGWIALEYALVWGVLAYEMTRFGKQ